MCIFPFDGMKTATVDGVECHGISPMLFSASFFLVQALHESSLCWEIQRRLPPGEMIKEPAIGAVSVSPEEGRPPLLSALL